MGVTSLAKIEKYCKKVQYQVQCIGIPKTVDNDLYGTDHTPGYPSAARYVALSVLQGGLLAKDAKIVDQFVIYQSVGRNSGWLAAAAALAKKKDSDPPHIILLPEVPFERSKFLRDFETCYKKYGWVSISTGEGITYADGTPVSSSKVTDKFKNIEYGAMGGTSVAFVLHHMITTRFKLRGEFQVPESLQMCAADRISEADTKEAFDVGVEAIKLFQKGKSGVMVCIIREKQQTYKVRYASISLEKVALNSRPLPNEFISKDKKFVTQKFIDFLRPLVGELPQYAELEGIPVVARSL